VTSGSGRILDLLSLTYLVPDGGEIIEAEYGYGDFIEKAEDLAEGGFATRAPERQAPVCYALSVIPALWAFFMAGGGPVSAGMNLVFGYLGLLALDWQFWRWRLAPDWWMRLRLPMTLAVVACLLAGTLL